MSDLSGVFGAVSNLASQTGLNTLTDGVLNGVSDVVDNVAGGVAPIPVVGPLANAASIDLQNTVAGIGEHLYDGKLVGAAVDGVTNHLGDSLLAQTTVDTVSGLPVVGPQLGGAVDGIRHEVDGVLGSVNNAIGSTPIGEGAAGDLSAAGDPFETLDATATAAAPAAATAAAAPAGVVEVADEAVGGTVGETVGDVTAAVQAPAAVVDGATDAVGGLGVTDAVQDVPVAGDVVGSVTGLADGLLGGLAGGAGAPAVEDVADTAQSAAGVDIVG